MSLKSWMKEFYGPMSTAKSSWRKACAHSLRKWEGASKANLKKHSVILTDSGIVDPKADGWRDLHDFYFDGDSCALCKRGGDLTKNDVNADICDVCPLKLQEGVDCNDYDSPFGHYMETGNPNKMIRALRKLDKTLSKQK